MKARVFLSVIALGLVALGVVAIAEGVSQIRTRTEGERTTARVSACDTTGTTKTRSVHCTGTWVAGGKLVGGGGHVVIGNVEGAGDDDVGRTIDVRLSGDGQTAYTPSLATPIVYVVVGLAFGGLAVLLVLALRRRAGTTGGAVRLEPLYRVRFTYPESWSVGLDGGWEQHLFLAEGRCEGAISGRFRGANFPLRRGAEGPFRPDFRAVIESDDGATIMFEWHGYGRAYPPGRRQVVGAVFHTSDDDRYRRLNDAVCVCVGEVRTPADPEQPEPDLVVEVAELIWEPIGD